MLKKTIPLNTDRTLDLNKWNTFSINLDELVKVDRGAIYRVELCFARRNAIYPCSNENEDEDALTYDPDEITENEMAYYDAPDGEGSYWDNEYYYYGSWRDRGRPM